MSATASIIRQKVYGLDAWKEEPDLLVVEEPLEIRLGFGPTTERQQRVVMVTMRTPGQDEELALGFLFTEGIIHCSEEVLSCRHCVQDATKQGNIVRVELHPMVSIDWARLERNTYTSSSCGLCGKTSIEAIRAAVPAPIDSSVLFSVDLIHQLPRQLQCMQRTFAYTGGLHAAGLFDEMGRLVLVREDVGRHNALDKLIGAAFWQGWLPLQRYGVLVSGRVGFELVQKAWMAGVPLLAAVGAPTSSSVEMAREAGMSLLGFVRNNQFNLYTNAERLLSTTPCSAG